MISQGEVRNKLLARMTRDDFDALAAHMVPVNFVRRDPLTAVGQAIIRSYFLESGIASVVATTPEGRQAEVGLIGREGMVEVSSVLGARTAPFEVFIQAEGSGFVLPSSVLLAAVDTRPALRKLLLAFAQTFLIQVSHTALAAASLILKARLARWLLMSADRTGPDIPMTHEFLSLMLNVRRPGVTEAVQALEAMELIEARRGSVLVRDRAGLLALAGDTYGAPEASYAELLG